MSSLDETNESLIAAAIGFNDGANKGFWRVQLRDRIGQWMEMGRGLLAKVRMPGGDIKDLRGVYIGPSTRTGYGRMLVENEDGSFTTYEVTSGNAQQFEATIAESDLERQGIKNDTPGDIGDRLDEDIQTEDDMNPQPSTDEDIKLATVVPDEKQKEIIKKSREESPLAKLPAGAERTMSKEELAKATGTSEEANYDEPSDDLPIEALAAGWGFSDEGKGVFLREASNEGDRATDYEITKNEKTGKYDVLRREHSGLNDRSGQNADYREYDEGSYDSPAEAFKEFGWEEWEAADAQDKGDDVAANLAETPYEDALVKMWNDAAYGDGADVDAALAKLPSGEKRKPKDFGLNVTGSHREYALDLAEGDYIYDPMSTDLFKISAEPFVNEDGNITVPAVDEDGNDVSFDFSNDSRLDKVSYSETPKEEPLPEAPELTDAAVEKQASEIKVGDKLWTQNGNYLGEVSLAKESKDAMTGKTSMRLRYTNEFGREYLLSYPMNTFFRVESPASEEEEKAPAAPEAPQAPEAPATPEVAPEAPTAPEATPEAPATPEATPAKPKKAKATKPVAVKPEVENKDRTDDGQPIAPVSMSNEEMQNLEVQEVLDSDGNPLPDLNGEPVYHANAILNAIMNVHPDAKLNKDGGLVIERASFTDHDGKEYDYEITLIPTFGGQVLEQYTIKDKEGNVVENFYHKDFKDSIRGIYGKKNGVVIFRDQLIGKAMPAGKLTRAKLSYFGKNKTLANRMVFFRGAGSKDPHAKAIKIQDVDQQMRDYLQGRGRLINETSKESRSANVRGSQARSFVASFFEAFEQKDTGLMRQILVQALGRMPDNEESRDKLVAILKDELKKRYMGTDRGHEIGLAVENLRRWMSTEGVDLRNLAKIPFVSTDGTTPVQVGDKVRAYGNENQSMIGQVVRLNKRTGKGGSYKDTIAIKFADGTVVNVFAARNVEIIGDDHPDADEPLDNYEPWIRGDEMRKIRLGDEPALPGEYVSFGPADAPDEDSANPDAGTPYLGSDGSEGSDNEGTPAEDKQIGDAWYGEDGEYLGSISEIVEVPAEDGGEPGIAIVYVDADGIEQVEVVDKGTTRSPK
jgi:hypothetical protein